MWRIMQRSLEEVLNSPEGFEHQSNLNLVYFYREELLKIYNGENAIKILGEGIHRNMTNQGILEVRYCCAGRGSHHPVESIRGCGICALRHYAGHGYAGPGKPGYHTVVGF